MSAITDLHQLKPSRKLPEAASSDLKNSFKPVFQRALTSGPVTITRNRKREAILLSTELYDQIVEKLAKLDPLEVYRAEYEKRFEAMQTAEAKDAFEAAFSATSDELGQAAVKHAKK